MPTPTLWTEQHTLGPVPIPESPEFSRADLEIYGIDHFSPSYTARVFINASAPSSGELTADHESYAGSFSIFGHQRCSGDEGHCTVHDHLRRFDDRPSHPLTRAFKRVVITDALRRVQDAGSATLTLTLVITALAEEPIKEPLFDCQGAQITTFD